jgi:hypothetical protein
MNQGLKSPVVLFLFAGAVLARAIPLQGQVHGVGVRVGVSVGVGVGVGGAV